MQGKRGLPYIRRSGGKSADMKKFRFFIIPVFFILPVFLSAQMESIVIDNPAFKSKSRSSVKFSHGNHMAFEGVSCIDCHHRFENRKNVLDPSELTDDNKSIYCSYCHSDASGLKNAYHRLCIRCHQSMIKKNKASGPRLCGECHK